MPTLSEADSKALLAGFGLPVLPERLVDDAEAAVAAADELGLPGGGQAVRRPDRPQDRAGPGAAGPGRRRGRAPGRHRAAGARPAPTTARCGLLVAPMVRGNRELIAGLADDPQFGMTVMVGVGGILAEARGRREHPAGAHRPGRRPGDDRRAGTQALLGPFRGEPAVDRQRLADVLLGLSAGRRGHPRAGLGRPQPADHRGRRARSRSTPWSRWRSADGDPTPHRAVPGPVRPQGRGGGRRLHPPRQVRVRGPAQHPGQRLRRAGSSPPTARPPRCWASTRVPSLDDIPDGAADLVFVCTPAPTNPDVLRAAAAKGITRRLPGLGRLRRGRRGGAPGPGRAGGAGRRAGRADRRAQRPGRGVHARRRCAPRSWRPTRRPGASGWPASRATSCPRS